MKLTTKIVIGFILSIFILVLGFIIVFSFTDRVNYSWNSEKLSISQENIISIDVEAYKTIWMDSEPSMCNEYNVYPEGTISIKPVTVPNEENKLFIPKELTQIFNIISSNDTLIIRLKIKDLYDKYTENTSRNKHLFSGIGGFNLSVHTNTVDIISNLSGIKTDVRNIETDKIKINTPGDIYIDSCQADIIEPYMISNRKSFKLKNSQVKELNIDLDCMANNWKVENCGIEVENLTGSDSYKVELPKSEAKVMNWIPKNKDAKLNVTLRGDTARIVFP